MKNRLFPLLLVGCMILTALVGLTSCDEDAPTSTPQKLSAPVVTLTDNVASWSADSNADKFEISLDGDLSYVENSVTSKTLTDGQTFKIRAVGDGSSYSTSDWSNSVTYTAGTSTPQPTKLGTPTVAISDEGLASWSEVANASSYVYKINGGAETPTTATSVQLTNGQSIVVKAVGDGTNYTDGDYSASQTYTAGTPTPQPTKLGTPTVTISSTGLASWTAVANASSYVYKIDGGAETSTTATSVQLSNGQSIVVKAVGDGTNYTDGDYSASQTYTTDTPDAVIIVDEYFLRGELVAENGKNGAKITVLAYIENDVSAYFERLEIYNGQTLVLTDNEFEGFSEYYDLNSKTEYTIKLYYASEDHGYTGRVKEVSVTTPAYKLPEIDVYDSENNVVVGKHALFSFNIEKYTDLKYYDVIVRGFTQDDAYFAPFIVEMLDDPTLLDRLQNESDKHYMRPGGYIWEAQHYMNVYTDYWQAWEHKERMGYSDDRWREIAASEKQYIYELSVDNGGLFVANDGDVEYNYYAVLRDCFNYEDLRLEVYLNFDLSDGTGIKEIKLNTAYPYFHGAGDENYGFDIEIDENVKNGYIFTETDYDYKTLYVHKIALYKDGEFVCYVPFEANDITSVDMEAWLEEWIEKLKCEIPDADVQEMIAKVGAEVIGEILGELWFEEEMGNDIIVDAEGMAGIVGGNKLGNQTERELLAALSSVDADTMLWLFKAQTQENKTLEAFIAESDNATIISVLNDFRDQIEITSQNAYAIYTAIDSVYDVSDQLERAYENCIREENAGKEVTDLIEAIQAISFKFIAGTNLAPAGDYELRVLYRSILDNYDNEDDIKGYSAHNIRIKMDLEAPDNVRLEGRRILWDAVENANEYVVYVNGEKRFTRTETYYDNYGEIQKGDKVQIVATGYYAYDSEPSDEYTFIPPQLNKPTVTVSGRRVSWNSVENANKYVYTVNGQQYETYSTSISVYESGTVRIKAVDENGTYLDSEWTSVTVAVGSSDKEK